MHKQVYKDNEPVVKLTPAKKVDSEEIAQFNADDQGRAVTLLDSLPHLEA